MFILISCSVYSQLIELDKLGKKSYYFKNILEHDSLNLLFHSRENITDIKRLINTPGKYNYFNQYLLFPPLLEFKEELLHREIFYFDTLNYKLKQISEDYFVTGDEIYYSFYNNIIVKFISFYGKYPKEDAMFSGISLIDGNQMSINNDYIFNNEKIARIYSNGSELIIITIPVIFKIDYWYYALFFMPRGRPSKWKMLNKEIFTFYNFDNELNLVSENTHSLEYFKNFIFKNKLSVIKPFPINSINDYTINNNHITFNIELRIPHSGWNFYKTETQNILDEYYIKIFMKYDLEPIIYQTQDFEIPVTIELKNEGNSFNFWKNDSTNIDTVINIENQLIKN